MSGDTTKLKIPLPSGSDTVLREAFENILQVIDNNAAAQTDFDDHKADNEDHSKIFQPTSLDQSGNDYPLGLTRAEVSSANGWPVTGTLLTNKVSNIRLFQFLVKISDSASNNTVCVRSWHNDYEWSNFSKIVLNVDLDELAGAERTTETVKGNAENLANHLADNNNPHKVSADHVKAVGKDIPETDWNNANKTGVYDGHVEENIPPFITAGYEQVGIFMDHDADDGIQIIGSIQGNQELAFRKLYVGTWGSWYRIWHSGNFGASSAYNGNHLTLGNYHLWIDSSGRLRVKNGTPTKADDGTIVGTQS